MEKIILSKRWRTNLLLFRQDTLERADWKWQIYTKTVPVKTEYLTEKDLRQHLEDLAGGTKIELIETEFCPGDYDTLSHMLGDKFRVQCTQLIDNYFLLNGIVLDKLTLLGYSHSFRRFWHQKSYRALEVHISQVAQFRSLAHQLDSEALKCKSLTLMSKTYGVTENLMNTPGHRDLDDFLDAVGVLKCEKLKIVFFRSKPDLLVLLKKILQSHKFLREVVFVRLDYRPHCLFIGRTEVCCFPNLLAYHNWKKQRKILTMLANPRAYEFRKLQEELRMLVVKLLFS